MGGGNTAMIVHATVNVAGFPPDSLVTLGEDLRWWAEDPRLAEYLQTLSPVLYVTPSAPSRVTEMYEGAKLFVPSLTSVGVETYDDPPHVPGRVY